MSAHAMRIAVIGDTHLPKGTRALPRSCVELFNPGSPTERRRAPHRTMGIATVERDELRFEHVVLDG